VRKVLLLLKFSEHKRGEQVEPKPTVLCIIDNIFLGSTYTVFTFNDIIKNEIVT